MESGGVINFTSLIGLDDVTYIPDPSLRNLKATLKKSDNNMLQDSQKVSDSTPSYKIVDQESQEISSAGIRQSIRNPNAKDLGKPSPLN